MVAGARNKAAAAEPDITKNLKIQYTESEVIIRVNKDELDKAIRASIIQSNNYRLSAIIDKMIQKELRAYVKTKQPELTTALKKAVDRKLVGSIKRVRVYGELTDAR